MQVILKPMGVVVVSAAILSLAAFALINHRSNSNDFHKEAAVGDGWIVKDGGKTIHQDHMGDEYREFPLSGALSPKIDPSNGKYSIAVKADALGSSQFSKYGVRIYTKGPISLVEGWIDPKFKVLATCGRGLEWKNIPLPSAFDMTKSHTLTMEWKDNGSTWTITVDNDPTVRQVRSLGRDCPADHISLISQDANVSYTPQ